MIAAGGRKTTPGEANYAPTKGELAAIVHALRQHKHILHYKPFVIMTDHQALKWLHSMKNPRGIFARWLMELQSFNFTVQHVPGKKTGAADGLSRSSHLPPPTQDEINEEEELIANIIGSTDGKGKKVTMDWENIRTAQEEDEVLGLVKRWLKTGTKPNKEEVKGLNQDTWFYYRVLNLLTLDNNDVIRIKGLNKDRTDRILIPDNDMLKTEVYLWSHEHPSAGHFGQSATVERARLHFYYPGMNHSLKKRVKACETCLQKIQKTDNKDAIHKPHKIGYPGEVLFLDLVGPLPETPDGMKYILTYQDGFSRFVCTSLIPCKEAAIVAN